jgi:hypothetical protein
VRDLRSNPTQGRNLFIVRELFLRLGEATLLAANNREKNTDDDYIYRQRDEEVLSALLNLPALLDVLDAGIVSVNPGVEGWAKNLFPSDDHHSRQDKCE